MVRLWERRSAIYKRPLFFGVGVTGGAWVGPQTITISQMGDVGLTIVGASGQTADYLQLKTALGRVFLALGLDVNAYINPAEATADADPMAVILGAGAAQFTGGTKNGADLHLVAGRGSNGFLDGQVKLGVLPNGGAQARAIVFGAFPSSTQFGRAPSVANGEELEDVVFQGMDIFPSGFDPMGGKATFRGGDGSNGGLGSALEALPGNDAADGDLALLTRGTGTLRLGNVATGLTFDVENGKGIPIKDLDGNLLGYIQLWDLV